MRLQPSKYEALCISNKRSPPMFTYFCDGQPLRWSNVVKYLGVHINQHLTWSDHCKVVCSRATKLLNLFHRMLFCCSQSAKALCFCALILPLTQYACPVWLSNYNKDLQLLESVQNRAARWLCGARFTLPTYAWSPSSRVCMSTLGWPSMNIRLITLSLLFLYDILKNRSSIHFHDYFRFNSIRTCSHSYTLLTKSSVLNLYRYSFFVNIVFLWNNLPYSIYCIDSLKVFCSAVLDFYS